MVHFIWPISSGTADYSGILLSSILPDSLGSGTCGGLGITGIKNAVPLLYMSIPNGMAFLMPVIPMGRLIKTPVGRTQWWVFVGRTHPVI